MVFKIRQEGKLHPLILLMIAITLGVIGQLTLKKGIGNVGVITLSGLHWGLVLLMLKQPFIVLGFCCYFLSAGLYMVVISQVPLSLAYPLVSIGYILVVFFSRIFFHEQVTVWRWLGVFLICTGVILVARSGSVSGKPSLPKAGVTQSVQSLE